MGHYTITAKLVIKHDSEHQAREVAIQKLNSWFQEDRHLAPPYEPGALLWWGISESKESTDTIINGEGERERAREIAYGLTNPGSTFPIYHIYRSDPDPESDRNEGPTFCGQIAVQLATFTPPFDRLCTRCNLNMQEATR